MRGVWIGERTDGHRKAWITPDIASGGFSTGKYLAGGPTKPHEVAFIEKHAICAGSDFNCYLRAKHGAMLRRATKRWCLTTSAGRTWFLDLSRSELDRVPTVEEGCFMAIVILEEAGISAEHLVEEVSPWFHLLRFFPELVETTAADGSISSIRSVGDLLSTFSTLLHRFEGKMVFDRLRRTAAENIYIPTYKAVVEDARRFCVLWSARVNTAAAAAAPEDDPCCLAPSAALCLATMRANLILFGFEKKLRRSSLSKLFDALEVVVLHGEKTRQTFVEHIQRHADAASARLARRGSNSTPPTADMPPRRQAFLHQLRGLVQELRQNESPSNGLSMDRVADMSNQFPLFSVEIRRVKLGPLGELAEAGLVSSSEMLALQAEGLAVKHRATHFAPEPARTLAPHGLTAFMKRRSRLLLALATQVRVSEIPWFGALADTFDTKKSDGHPDEVVRPVNRVAREVFRAHVTCFAGTQTPNRLVRLLGEAARGDSRPRHALRELDYYARVLVEFPRDAASRTVSMWELGSELSLGESEGCGKRTVVKNGIAIERVAANTTHNLLHLVVALEMDKNAAVLEHAATVAPARLAESLRSKSTHYRFLRDESRRAAACCRAFLVFVSLLKKVVDGYAFAADAGVRFSCVRHRPFVLVSAMFGSGFAIIVPVFTHQCHNGRART
ncbi:unnamed protein product [Ectocarpus sp. CCAP 1310/34]|nr:unnamed protein product [Ectocarpus sp. CCAP 1310/34]